MTYSFLGEKASGPLYGSRGRINGYCLLNTDVILITKGAYNGQLAVPKWHQVKKKKKKLYQLVPSIYLVHRQAVNILAQYNLPFYGEKSKMREAIKIARDLNLMIIGLKKGNLEEYEKKLASKVDEIFNIVGLVRNQRKRAGLKVIEPVAEITDSRGQVNPGAFRARTIAGVNRFQERKEEILKIETKIVSRLTTSKALFDFTEYVLASSCHFLDAIYDYALNRDYQVENQVRKRMAGRLSAIISDLETIKFQPFLINCQLSIKELQKAKDLIRFGDILEGIRQITFSYNSLKLKKIQGELEDLIMEITYLINSQSFLNQSSFFIKVRLRAIEEALDLIDEGGFKKKSVLKAMDKFPQIYQVINKGKWLEVKHTLKQVSEIITWF
ncbi:MAG: hypothetical protein U5L76_03135 [Patescibacteria group bacterium]|nr:hypothetical protein [Patescibacteria group bacterium]